MPGRKTLAGIAGAAAAAALIAAVPQFEGVVLKARPDPVGIITACMGDTHDVKAGQVFTLDECNQRLQDRLTDTAAEVDACTPLAKMTTGQKVAFIDLAYNIGSGKYCGSTAARHIKAGDYPAACAELSKWVYAGGKPLPGLVKRRAWERSVCEGKAQ